MDLIKNRNKNEIINGYWATIPNPQIHEIAGIAGYDFGIIDFEHGNFSYETALNCIIAMKNKGMNALVRPASNNPREILSCLEIGCDGLMIPHIKNEDEANQVIKSSFYPPIGERGSSGFTRSSDYGNKTFYEHVEYSNQNMFIGVLIESLEGLKNINNILKVKEVDCIYFGTYDIASTAGIQNQNSIEVFKLIDDAIKSVKRDDVFFGQVVVNQNQLKNLNNKINFIAHGVDCGTILNGFKNNLNIR